MITLKPIHPHTVTRTIEYRAPSELLKNPTGCAGDPIPNFCRTQFARPKFASRSHRNMIAVAIDDTTTGTKIAVRYRRIPWILRFSAIATNSDPAIDAGTNRTVYTPAWTMEVLNSGSFMNAR